MKKPKNNHKNNRNEMKIINKKIEKSNKKTCEIVKCCWLSRRNNCKPNATTRFPKKSKWKSAFTANDQVQQ